MECKAILGNARAHLYGKKGGGRALELVRRALPLAEQVKDASYHFDAWDFMAQVQIAGGDYVGAADSMNRAFAVAGTIKDYKDLYYGYLDRADVYQHFAERCDYERDFQPCLDAVERARRDYESAYAAAKRLGWDGLAQQARNFITLLGVREQLIRSHKEAHTLMGTVQLFSPEKANDIVVSESFTTTANPHLPAALAWIESQGGIPSTGDARGAYIKGLLAEGMGERDESLMWYLRAAELLEQERLFLDDERTRGSYVEDKVEFYYGAMLQLLDRRQYKEAFDLMERSRSRVMSDLLATKSLALSSPQERALYGGMLQLRSETAEIQACLFAVRGGEDPGSNCQRRHQSEMKKKSVNRGAAQDDDGGPRHEIDAAELESLLGERQRQYDAVRERMEKQTLKLARLVTSQPASLDAVQKVLARDGSEMLSYVVLESQLIIWHIGPDSVHVRSVFLPRSALKDKIARIRQSLIDPKRAYDQKRLVSSIFA